VGVHCAIAAHAGVGRDPAIKWRIPVYTPGVSRAIANLVTGMMRTLVAPLSRRQQHRVYARVIEKLNQLDLTEVTTPRGTLKLTQLRGAFAASAVARFHTDEPETLAWIDGFTAGDTLWDVGANIGLYALYAALDPTIRVLAFEPSAFNFGLLVEHIALNRMGDRVKPLCVALGNSLELGELCMRHTDAGHGSNGLNQAANNFGEFAPVFRQAIPAFPLDGFRALFGIPPPTHLKIDVDGIELEIIRGAAGTLPHVRSVLVEVEGVTGNAAAPEIVAVMGAAGLVEEPSVRTRGSCRNRLFVRKAA